MDSHENSAVFSVTGNWMFRCWLTYANIEEQGLFRGPFNLGANEIESRHRHSFSKREICSFCGLTGSKKPNDFMIGAELGLCFPTNVNKVFAGNQRVRAGMGVS